jgi:hypothetical protein
MLDFMREGGFTMWLLLAAVIGTAVKAARSAPGARASVLLFGAAASLVIGLYGLSMGMTAVAGYFDGHPDATAHILAVGIGELSRNGSFAAGLALVQGLAGMTMQSPNKG